MDRYRVVRCLAHGGMGAVYEVLHQETERPLALKVLLPLVLADEDARARFAQEARVTARVRSDHIVDVVDAGVDDESGMPFLVMELVDGEDLGEMLGRGPLDSSLAVLLLAQAAVALDRCHAHRIVHRDLKPGNLMVTARDDGSPQVKILDFGVAKVIQPGAHSTGTRSVGTTLYMAPEQITGDYPICPATDRYSLAQLAYTMLVGKAYFHREAAELEPYPLLALVAEGPRESACMRAKREHQLLPVGFDGWFSRATTLDPSERPSSAAELVRGLATAIGVAAPPFLRGHTAGATPLPGVSALSGLPGRAKRARRALAVFGLLLTMAVSVWLAWPRPPGAEADRDPTAAAAHADSGTSGPAATTDPDSASWSDRGRAADAPSGAVGSTVPERAAIAPAPSEAPSTAQAGDGALARASATHTSRAGPAPGAASRSAPATTAIPPAPAPTVESPW